MTLLLATLWACTGDGVDDTAGPTDDSAGPSDTDTSSPSTDETPTSCAPSIEIGTGEQAFESLGDELVMINGPQGGWHVVTALRMCELGTDATLSFRAVRASDGLEVGGSGTVQRPMLPDGPCCVSAVDIFTYLLMPDNTSPATALHDQLVHLDVTVSLPDGTTWTDEASVHFLEVPTPGTE